MTKDQVITDNYAIYNSDCMYVLPTLGSESVDFSVYSPPFAGLYNYSSSENDFSNCDSRESFLKQYEFLIEEISRVAFQCSNIFFLYRAPSVCFRASASVFRTLDFVRPQ